MDFTCHTTVGVSNSDSNLLERANFENVHNTVNIVNSDSIVVSSESDSDCKDFENDEVFCSSDDQELSQSELKKKNM